MVKPNFFIIGAPKCGTTALVSYLKDHPNIFMSNPKELNFFDFDFHSGRKTDWASYLAHFRGADPAVHLAVGEASPHYLESSRAVGEILKFSPEARFIVMLRNPVDFVHSLHSQLVLNGEEDILDFEEAWRAQEDRRRGRRIPPSTLRPTRLFYFEQGCLSRQVERLFAVADRGKVHTVIFDDFAKDTRGAYEGVLSFLGVPSDGRTEFARVNESKKLKFPRLQQVLKRGTKMKKKWGFSFKTGIFHRVRLLNSHPSPRKPLPEGLRAELKEVFRGEMERLSIILGRDLSHWI